MADVANANDNVHIIDWYAETQGHDEYLAENGINLTDEGVAAYTALVKKMMGSE